MSELQQVRLEIDRITNAEAVWIGPRMDPKWWQENYSEGFMGFDMRIKDATLHIESDHVDIEGVCFFVKAFLRAHRPRQRIIIEYCWHGDMDYGGALAVVEARAVHHFNPHNMAQTWLRLGICKPVTERDPCAIERLKEAGNEDGSDQIKRS
jgi:hypothetical protein